MIVWCYALLGMLLFSLAVNLCFVYQIVHYRSKYLELLDKQSQEFYKDS